MATGASVQVRWVLDIDLALKQAAGYRILRVTSFTSHVCRFFLPELGLVAGKGQTTTQTPRGSKYLACTDATYLFCVSACSGTWTLGVQQGVRSSLQLEGVSFGVSCLFMQHVQVVCKCPQPFYRNHDVLWMDEILHHLRNPGRMIPPLKSANNGFSWFQSGANGFHNHCSFGPVKISLLLREACEVSAVSLALSNGRNPCGCTATFVLL